MYRDHTVGGGGRDSGISYSLSYTSSLDISPRWGKRKLSDQKDIIIPQGRRIERVKTSCTKENEEGEGGGTVESRQRDWRIGSEGEGECISLNITLGTVNRFSQYNAVRPKLFTT